MGLTDRILVVEDEPESREFLQEMLSPQFSVMLAEDGAKAVDMARDLAPDVILLDIRMPKLDGLSVVEALRSEPRTRNIPVIMVSACDDEVHRTQAFLKGADDFVGKPFRKGELVARILSKLRWVREFKTRSEETPVLLCGNLKLDSRRYEVIVGVRPVLLTVLEFDLLRFLIQNREILLSRQMILEALWKGTVVTERTVDTHIGSLRRKLAGFDHTLDTVYGAGYILRPGRGEA